MQYNELYSGRAKLDALANHADAFWIRGGAPLEHLIYAYMIENTGIYEVFAKVVAEIQNGEKLGPVDLDTLDWVRATESYFFSNLPSTSPLNVQSSVRPDARATRRNAYHRLLGMELNDGPAGGTAYPFVRSDTANTQLVPVLESLLREVWVARVNRDNVNGAKPTDEAKIHELVQHLQAMLRGRRQVYRFDQIEFHAVATMSWLHQAISTFDTNPAPPPVPEVLDHLMKDLQCSGLETPEQRLFKVAQLVGYPAHGLSRSFFVIAQPLADLFRRLEGAGSFSDPSSVEALYKVSPLASDMDLIIQHWSIISGRDLKAPRVSTA